MGYLDQLGARGDNRFDHRPGNNADRVRTNVNWRFKVDLQIGNDIYVITGKITQHVVKVGHQGNSYEHEHGKTSG